MNRITHLQQGLRGQGFKGSSAEAGLKPAPARIWGADVWLFVMCVCTLAAFCLGLYLGGNTMRNKIDAVEAEMEDTRAQLAKKEQSVILVDKNFAERIGFSLRMNDLTCTGRQ